MVNLPRFYHQRLGRHQEHRRELLRVPFDLGPLRVAVKLAEIVGTLDRFGERAMEADMCQLLRHRHLVAGQTVRSVVITPARKYFRLSSLTRFRVRLESLTYNQPCPGSNNDD